MYTLPNFPLKNQLSQPTVDGQSDENARLNCVPTSISAGLQYLTGKTFDGDQLKDAVYGQGTTGTEAAANYVNFCKSQGVALVPFSGSQQALVSKIHEEISAGNPVVLTMPSQWGTAPADPVHPAGYTHVGIAAGQDVGVIRVMNPWGGFWQDQSDAWWQARLCYGQVWVMSKESLVLNVTDCPVLFSGANADGSWNAKNGQRLYGAILTYFRNNAGPGGSRFGMPLTDELPVENGYIGRVRIFERGVICFDPEHRWDHVPGEPDANCYTAHIDKGFANGWLSADVVKPVQDKLDSANQALTSAEQKLADLNSQLSALKSQEGNATALVAALKAVLS